MINSFQFVVFVNKDRTMSQSRKSLGFRQSCKNESKYDIKMLNYEINSPNSVNWSQVKRILTNPVPKLGNRVKKLHAVDTILDELNLKKAPLLRSFIGL